jgi:hypothetical protein
MGATSRRPFGVGSQRLVGPRIGSVVVPYVVPPASYFAGSDKVVKVAISDGSVLGYVDVSLPGGVRGLTFDGEYIWAHNAANPTKILKIDPVSLAILGTYYHGNASGYNQIAFDGTNLWITNDANVSAVCFDRGGTFVLDTGNKTLGGTWSMARGLAYDGRGSLWGVCDNYDTRVVRVNAGSGNVSYYSTGGPFSRTLTPGTVAGNYVYFLTRTVGMNTEEYLTRVGLLGGSVTNTHIGTGWANGGSIVSDDTYLYMTGSSNSRVKKWRISDYNEEWDVSSQGIGHLCLDGLGNVWDHWYGTFPTTHVRLSSDGTRADFYNANISNIPGICCSGYVLPMA